MQVITVLKYKYHESSCPLLWGVSPHSGFVLEDAIASGKRNVQACGAEKCQAGPELIFLSLLRSRAWIYLLPVAAQVSGSTLPVC